MTSSIIPFIKVIPAVTRTLYNLLRQKSFLRSEIKPLIRKYTSSNDGSITEKDTRKIFEYYGLAVPAVLGEAFAQLYGRKLSGNERKCLTSLGAMTGLFDDFFDEGMFSNEMIKEKILHPHQGKYNTSNERLFQKFYCTALETSPSDEDLKSRLLDVYDAQVKSKTQTELQTSIQEIHKITIEKGGTSLLFYRSGLSEKLVEEEEHYLFDLGGLMQLSNDIFDIYKDLGSGVRTLITETSNVDEIEQYFRQCLRELYKPLKFYKPANQKKFLEMISLAIFSRVYVCLDQMKRNQAGTNGIFTPALYNRQQLICDMDNKKNMLRSAAYHIQIMKYFTD